VVDRVYPLEEAQAAHERFSTHCKLRPVIIDTSL
jgi:hypothetical protein